MSVIARGRVAIWGIESVEGDTYAAGLIMSQTVANESEKAFVKDYEGHTVGQIIFDDKNNCEVEVDCESGASLPAIGDDVVIGGFDCIVQDSTFKWQNDAIKRFSLKATKYALLVEEE
jgi:hypothetical protein